MNSKIIRIAIVALAVLVAVAMAVFCTSLLFSASAKEKLEREAQMQVLRFESQLNGEIKLAIQMAKSPVVIGFMENPKDEFYSVAGVNEIRLYQESFLGKSSFWASTADDVFWSNCQPVYTIDKNDPSQYWYKMTLYETDVYNFNINYNADLKQTCLWLNAVVRNAAKQPVGICGTGIPLDNFINGLFSSLNSDASLEMYMFNDKAEITGAEDQKLVEGKVHIGDAVPDLAGHEAYSEQGRFVSTFGGEYILVPMKTVGWTLVLHCPMTFSAFMGSAAVPFGLLLLIVFVIAIVSVSRRVFMPLGALNRTVADMSFGNADLTQRIKMDVGASLPVIRHLVDGFNSFIEKIQRTLQALKLSEEQLEHSREKLNEGTDATMNSIGEISTDIGNFTSSIKRQTSSVQQAADAMQQISANIGSLDNMISTQVSAVTDASSAVERMLGNIKNVNGSVEDLSRSFAALEQNTAEGVAKHNKVNEKITQIQEESAMLAEANKVISSIASQTNLLAMNAAIEAAHAGDAGRGFSVVADEIRKLSENSSAQSKTISQKLSDIHKSIEEVVAASGNAGAAFRGVSDKINETNLLVRQITKAMTEQESGSRQISESLRTLNNSSAEVREASREMRDGGKTILDEVQFLQDSTGEMDSGMDALDRRSAGLKGTQDVLSSLSKEMDGAIAKMRSSLDMFRV